MQFKQPPILHNENGEARTVGFELEYTNVGVEESAQLIQDLYGGEIEKKNRFKQKVKGTSLGDFTVEFDLTLLTEKRYKSVFETFNIHIEDVKLGSGTLEDEVEETLSSIISKVIPNEIACPPVPCTKLDQLEKLRKALYDRRAEGTESFITNAFGTHINVEVPAADVETILTYLRAFLLLYPWLLQKGKTDLARKMSPFINPYPTEYVELALNTSYHPDLSELIQDYHVYNPDRNRPLDLYPLFAALRNDLLESYSDIGKVKARKTFHYRLPNSSVAQPDWTLAQEWNNWVFIEELAYNREKVHQLCQEYIALKEDTLVGFESRWIKRTEQWLTY
ncbi:amidoligase family protein [Pontibacter korlensis]|uniref:Amidoligase n=1 Tax=Pontibacter korlensis TaxID=400092 RepID=A0A0E3UXZ4_9BACT|nr:amidoligase family protein [Pontibacter korlensis]AKD04011.1 amidoligase [Pontibacter korlensis]